MDRFPALAGIKCWASGLGVGLAACVTVVACGGHSSEAPSPTAGRDSLAGQMPTTTTTGPTETSIEQSTTTTTTSVPVASGQPAAIPTGTPRCGPRDLGATFVVQPTTSVQPTDRTRALVTLTNKSAAECTVEGFVGLVPGLSETARPLLAERLDQPSGPEPVDVAPGGSAFAGAEWTSSRGCPPLGAFSLKVPGDDATVPVQVVGDSQTGNLRVCDRGLKLGPLEVSAEGTVAFPDSTGIPVICSPNDLSARLATTGKGAGASSFQGRLSLENTSQSACSVNGFPTIRFLSRNGTALPATATITGGSSKQVVIRPGSTVASTIRFSLASAAQVSQQQSCTPVAARIALTLPGQDGSLTVPGPGARVCGSKTLQVTPLEPAR